MPDTQLSALNQLFKIPNVKLSLLEDNSGPSSTKSSSDDDDPNHEPRRSGRVK